MRYVAIDIETTGLNPENCQTLEIGAVFDDSVTPLLDLPQFNRAIKHDILVGEAYALAMHAHRLNKFNKRGVLMSDVMNQFHAWLYNVKAWDETGKIVIAGKNFAKFDLRFLERLPYWSLIKYHHRIIDVGSLYMNAEDDVPPSLNECMQRAGVKGQVQPTAVEDCMNVVFCIRAKFGVQI